MIRWQITLFWPLVAALLALAAFTLYVYIHSEGRYRLKLVLIPALLAATTFSFTWFGARLGYACPAGLPASFEYLAHRVVAEQSRKAWIEILVLSRKPLERDARLHRVPWSKALEEALTKARQMKQAGGGWIEMDRHDGDDAAQWVPKRVLPQDVSPKDPLPQERDLLRPQGPLT